MRTTITFDDDNAAAIEQLRHARGVGVSEVVNDLVRRGRQTKSEPNPFQQKTAELGLKMDVRNTAEALEHLEGPHHR